MSKKPTGLAGFTTRPTSATDLAETPATGRRRRGMGDVVAVSIRFSRADWERLHQLAVAEGESLQSLTIKGLSKVFEEKGLPGIK